MNAELSNPLLCAYLTASRQRTSMSLRNRYSLLGLRFVFFSGAPVNPERSPNFGWIEGGINDACHLH